MIGALIPEILPAPGAGDDSDLAEPVDDACGQRPPSSSKQSSRETLKPSPLPLPSVKCVYRPSRRTTSRSCASTL